MLDINSLNSYVKKVNQTLNQLHENEMLKAISQLNSNMAVDESDLTTEHLKNSGDTLTKEIKKTF